MVLEEEIVNVIDDEVESPHPPSKSGGGSSKRNRRAKIWETDFDLIERPEGDFGKCRHCGHVVSAPGNMGTSNLKRHLAGCSGRNNHDVSQMLIAASGKLMSRQFDYETFKELCANMCFFHSLPYSFVDWEHFRKLCEYLNPKVKHLSRNTVKSTIGDVNDRERHKIEHFLKSLPGRICLTSDMWTSNATQGYISLTAHFIDCAWNLHSVVLHLHHLPPPHTALAMHNCLLQLLKEWGIEKKIFSITLDNARTNDNMQDHLRESLSLVHPLPCDGKYFHIRCGAHILNLIVEDGLKFVDVAVNKLRHATNWLDVSEGRKLAFVESGKSVGCEFKKGLIRDVSTRWNSTHDMIERALLFKDAFIKFAEDDKNFLWNLTETEWFRVEKICVLLRPFKNITTLISGSKYPTANLYFKSVWEIEMALVNQSASDDEGVRTMVEEMKKKFDKYWTCYSMILAFAVVLDPRYKMDYIKYCFQKLVGVNYEQKVKSVLKAMEELFEEYLMEDEGDVPSQPLQTSSYELDSDFGSYEPSRLTSSKSKLHIYLEESRLPLGELDILTWWKTNEHRYPSVARMARDILAIPITTVASELTFSLSGRILTKFRLSTLPENAEALVQTRSWLSSVNNIDVETDSEQPSSVEFQPYASSASQHQNKRSRTIPSSHESNAPTYV